MIKRAPCLMCVAAILSLLVSAQTHAQDTSFMRLDFGVTGVGNSPEAAIANGLQRLDQAASAEIDTTKKLLNRMGFRVVSIVMSDPEFIGPFKQPDGSFACLARKYAILVIEEIPGGGDPGGEPVEDPVGSE